MLDRLMEMFLWEGFALKEMSGVEEVIRDERQGEALD